MFNIQESNLTSVIVHYVGNRIKDDELRLSEHASSMDEPTRRIIWEYVLSAFKTPDYYRFTHPADLEMNNVYALAKKIFNDPVSLVKNSASLAKLLYDHSQHPQIKSGELMVMYFDSLQFADIEAPAIGLFKSEQKRPFLFTEEENNAIDIYSYQGISPNKVDKACLIFNHDAEGGYHVLSVDNINKGEEAKFWFNNFLKIKSRSTEFTKTASLISLTKNFINTDLHEEAALERDQEIDLLNRSKEYFKESDRFEYEEFAEQVFEDRNVAQRFREYTTNHDRDELNLADDFEISQQAVRKQQRFFKSVLKLDKNFHVYIHGNRQMIEKGTDADGRKYYKLYYEEEH